LFKILGEVFVLRLGGFLFGLNVLDVVSFFTFNFRDVVISVVVPSSGGRSEGSRVGPRAVLGFVGGISLLELSLNVPEVETVSPDDLENEAGESRDDRGQEDSGRVIFSVVGEESSGAAGDVDDQEDDG